MVYIFLLGKHSVRNRGDGHDDDGVNTRILIGIVFTYTHTYRQWYARVVATVCFFGGDTIFGWIIRLSDLRYVICTRTQNIHSVRCGIWKQHDDGNECVCVCVSSIWEFIIAIGGCKQCKYNVRLNIHHI